jgi:hypothetical protein
MMGASVIAGCSSSAPADAVVGPRAPEVSIQSRVLEPTSAPYSFFVATRWSGQYRVTALNRAPFACGGDLAATSCVVPAVDLSLLQLPPDVSAQLLGRIGWDPLSPSLVFAGSIGAAGLQVQEIWRAPVAAPIFGRVFHVSHDPEHALVVNRWTTASLGTLDFSEAPRAEMCGAADAGAQCVMSQDPVLAGVASPTGVLLTGSPADGTFYVEQYFLKITVGLDQDGDGYSYCREGQTVCASGSCSDSGICLHWGGRGLIRIYARSADPSFDAWLVSTGQLSSSDSVPSR